MGKKRIVMLATAIAVVFLYVIPFAFAEDKEITRLTLRGIKEVNVVIETIEPEIEQLGLTQAQVQADVEAKLRGANIAVAPQIERGRPAIYLYVQVIRPEKINRLFYSISLSLLQNVILERDTEVKTNTNTWLVRVLGMSSGTEAIRSDIRSLLDQFIDDYRKANQ
ncbi:MAG: transcriptional regulator, Fis family [Deltaproteobacteria bacterium]|nr:transcriptional regulator, Fis family [Deltaproteobacteria bacterium]